MFDVNGSEFWILLVVAVVVIGPARLPGYVAQVKQWAVHARTLVQDLRGRVESELGADAGVDWAALDPRAYDPRRIVRDALAEDAPASTPPSLEPQSPAPQFSPAPQSPPAPSLTPVADNPVAATPSPEQGAHRAA